MNIQPIANTLRSRYAGVLSLVALVLAGAALAAACTGGDEGAPATSETAAPAGTQAVTGLDFPTGPAVLVAADYQYPGDRVDSTGAYLPANGKPTLVFVDAIW